MAPGSPEHVPSHDHGADIGSRLFDDLRAGVDLAAFQAMLLAEGRERNAQSCRWSRDAERVLTLWLGSAR